MARIDDAADIANLFSRFLAAGGREHDIPDPSAVAAASRYGRSETARRIADQADPGSADSLRSGRPGTQVTAALPPPAQASRRDVARGTARLMLFKLAGKCIGLDSTLVLARLLVPADFGLVALAMAVIAFTQLMGAFGFDSALIQRQDATHMQYSASLTFNVIVGYAMSCTLTALAVPVARFYDDDRLVAILFVLGAGAVVGGFGNVGTVAFRKDLDFRSEFRLMLCKRVATFAVTMLVAITLRSYGH